MSYSAFGSVCPKNRPTWRHVDWQKQGKTEAVFIFQLENIPKGLYYMSSSKSRSSGAGRWTYTVSAVVHIQMSSYTTVIVSDLN